MSLIKFQVFGYFLFLFAVHVTLQPVLQAGEKIYLEFTLDYLEDTSSWCGITNPYLPAHMDM